MKAFRNYGGNVTEVEVDTDLNGAPILPPDTTIDTKPEAQAGHYVTIVGDVWVQIPIPQEVISFEYKKQKALESLSKYKAWYTEQPTSISGVLFDANEISRNRITQTLVGYSHNGYLPPAWIDASNTPHAITTIADLESIISGIQTAFAIRFFEMNTIRQQILTAADETALNAVVIPNIPNTNI